MAVLTPVSVEQARALGAAWGLEVTGVRGIPAGSVNSNYELSLATGERVFLRVYEERAPTEAEGEAALLDVLAAGGVPTPRPLRRTDGSGRFSGEHAGKAIAVFPWVDGEILCQARVTADHTRQVGEALARVHVAGRDAAAPMSRFGAAALGQRLANLPASAREGDVGDAARWLQSKLVELAPAANAPSSELIHGDLFRDNVLWQGGRISALLDFESASPGVGAFDVMVTMLSWCFSDRLDLALASSLVGGYESVRPLSPGERADLFDQGRFAAVRFAITRITDFELRPAGTGVYKDFRRFLARLAALERLGPQGLSRALWP